MGKFQVNLTIALLFALPFLMVFRYFAFGTVALILAFVTIYIWLKERSIPRSFFKEPLSYGLLAYIATFWIVSLTSSHPATSFFSSFHRTDGAFVMLFLLFFALSIYTSISLFGKQIVFKFLKASVLGAVILSVLIMLSSNGLGLILPSDRGGATIANSSLAALFIIWNVFFAATLGTVSRKWLWALPVLLASPLFISWHSFGLGIARAAAISVLFGALLAAALWLSSRYKKTGAMITVVLLLVPLIGGFLVFKQERARTLFIENVGENRLMFWDAAIQGFKKDPVLGRGPGTFNDVFSEFFNPRILLPENPRETLTDKTHNIIFQHLSDGGVLLLLGLGLFVGSIGVSILRKLKEQPVPAALMAGAVAAWFLQVQFAFDSISSLVMLFMATAIVYAQGQVSKSSGKINKPVLWTAAVCLIALFIFVIVLPGIKLHTMNRIYESKLPERAQLWNFSGISPMGDRDDVVLVFNNVLTTYSHAAQQLRTDKRLQTIALIELDNINAYLLETLQEDNYSFILLTAQLHYLRMYIANDVSGETLETTKDLLNKAMRLSATDPRPRELLKRLTTSG